MSIEFFENELTKAQTCFNRIYQLHENCCLDLQCKVALSIVSLGMLCKKFARAPVGNINSEDKAKFIQTRNWLHNKFQQIENEVRRQYGPKNRLKDRYQGRYVPTMRQSLPGDLARGG